VYACLESSPKVVVIPEQKRCEENSAASSAIEKSGLILGGFFLEKMPILIGHRKMKILE